MKKTICDRCGHEEIGRNPENFCEHLINNCVYIDLCANCNNEYTEIFNKMDSEYRLGRRKKLEEFLKNLSKNG